jgi:hypothetical protein
MTRKISTILIILVFCFSCADKKLYSEKLNGTWINTSTSDTYYFNYPDVEFILAEDYQKIAKRVNKKKTFKKVKLDEGFRGTYEADETTVYITYYQSRVNDIWQDIDKGEITEIPFQYELDNDALILHNAFGKRLKLVRQDN